MAREKLTDYVGLRLTKTLLGRIEEYGRENFPNDKSQLGFDRTATIQDLLQLALDRNEFNSVKQRKTISPETENDIRIKELEQSVEALKLNVTQLFTLLNNRDKDTLNLVTQNFTQVEDVTLNDVTQDLTEDIQEVETGEIEPDIDEKDSLGDELDRTGKAKDVNQTVSLSSDRTGETPIGKTLEHDGYLWVTQEDICRRLGIAASTFSGQTAKQNNDDLADWFRRRYPNSPVWQAVIRNDMPSEVLEVFGNKIKKLYRHPL